MPADLYYRVLGPVVVERDGDPIDIGSAQPRGVLALLLLHANHVASGDDLIDAIWGEDPPVAARTQLQGLVSGLRRCLGAGDREAAPIETVAPGYRLRVPPGALDLDAFRTAMRDAQARADDGEPAEAAELLRTALGRWRGPAFADVAYPAVRMAAAGLDEMRLTALEDRIGADIEAGRVREVAAELRTLVGEHPLRERLCAQYMTVLARSGRAADALAAFRAARRHLADELGIEPSETLQRLNHAVLTGELSSDDHRTASASRRRAVPRQLPADIRVLIGRDELLETAARLLRPAGASAAPCLAATGPGGVGKTAFAIRLAHRTREGYPDEQIFAQLGGAGRDRRQPGAVLSGFLHALGMPPGDVPGDLDERASVYRDLLAERRVLLLLDDVADEQQIRPLLPATPGCAVIATSRRRFADFGSLRPLPLDVLVAEPGVELLGGFVGTERVRAEPEAAAEIVRLCGGLPLAIRIVGARLATRPGWSLAHMVRRLADRQRRLDWLELGDAGVRASIAESYAGLTGDQRRLFRGLGLLDTTEFPAWVAAPLLDRPIGEAELTLDELADVHLVEPAGSGVSGPRYRVHHLIHLLAGELAADDPPDVRTTAVEQVAGCWLDLAATADAGIPHWYGLDPDPPAVARAPDEARATVRAAPMTWLDEERGTLTTVLRQAAEHDRAHIAWPLAQHLSTYLDLRGRYEEWAGILHAGLGAAERAGDRAGIACMLGLLLDAEGSQDHFAEARRYAGRAVEAYGALGAALIARGGPPGGTSPAPPELDAYRESLDRARTAGDPAAIGWACFAYAVALRRTGVPADYLPLFEEARGAFHACGARIGELWALKNIGLAYVKRGRLEDALACVLRGDELLGDLPGDMPVTDTPGDIIRVFTLQGRHDEADRIAREYLAQARAYGHPWDEGRILEAIGRLRHDHGDHDGALNALVAALAVWRREGARTRAAHTMRDLAEVCAAGGDAHTSGLYLAEASLKVPGQ